jgi:hypothetical protein
MTIHQIPEIRCLQCDSLLNHASDNEGGSAPNPGDFTICLYCKHIMAFKDDLTLRALTSVEQVEADMDESVREAREFADLYKAFKTKH